MRVFTWLLRALVFFVLFAFALNNQHEVQLKALFGLEWRTRMVFVVLFAFALGCVFGVLAMVPSWWRHRRVARRRVDAPVTVADTTLLPPQPDLPLPHHTIRDGI